MNPKKSISSRYSTAKISSGNYGTFSVTSNTMQNTGNVLTTGSYGSLVCSGTVSLGTGTISTLTTGSQSTWIPYIGTTFTYKHSEVDIEVLGKKFSISEDTFQQLYLAQIDFHGIAFYKSLKKNGLLIQDTNVKNYLESLLRDNYIEKILKNLS